VSIWVLTDDPTQANEFRKVATTTINKWGTVELNVPIYCFEKAIIKLETSGGFMTKIINCDNIDATGSVNETFVSRFNAHVN